MIIVIEGADGSGKSTVAKKLAERIGADVWHFPNDATATGKAIRSYLRGQWRAEHRQDMSASLAEDDTLSALVFQALQVTNRMEVMGALRHAQQWHDHTILTRYWHSGWVYGQIDGLDREWLRLIHSEMVQPDAAVLIDTPPAICMERRAQRDGVAAPEIYEGKLELTKRIVDLYRELWAIRPGPGRWFTEDGQQPADLIADTLAFRMIGRVP